MLRHKDIVDVLAGHCFTQPIQQQTIVTLDYRLLPSLQFYHAKNKCKGNENGMELMGVENVTYPFRLPLHTIRHLRSLLLVDCTPCFPYLQKFFMEKGTINI